LTLKPKGYIHNAYMVNMTEMKPIREIWSAKKQAWISVDEALKMRCVKCGGRFVLEGDFLKCEKGCGKVSIREREVLEGEEWIIKALTGNIVYTVASGEDGSVQALSARVPPDIWKLIARDMYYIRSEEDMEGLADWGGERYRGWAVGCREVEKTLVREAEKRATATEREEAKILLEREEAMKKRDKEVKVKKEELKLIINELHKAFENAEYPKDEFTLEGEEIQNPFNAQNIYGGGEWFVIREREIWYVQNNGMDGDDWSRNNVRTGGAGAIGVKLPYSKELAEKIRRLKEVKEISAGDYAEAMRRRIEGIIR